MKKEARIISAASFLAVLMTSSLVWAAPGPLVEADWLKANLKRADVAVLDIRNQIDGGGAEAFAEGHIAGAVHSDYLKDNWRVARGEVVGLLPNVRDLEKKIGALGVSNNHHVVLVYGGVSSSDFGSAARIYWTFKYLGHDKISILNGGHAGWVIAEGALETGKGKKPLRQQFRASPRPQLLADIDEVRKIVDGKLDAALVDARPREQFLGKTKHPKAAAYGRLKDGIFQPESKSFDENPARLKSKQQLQTLFAELPASKTLVSYCNTGHFAATNWFVFSEITGSPGCKTV